MPEEDSMPRRKTNPADQAAAAADARAARVLDDEALAELAHQGDGCWPEAEDDGETIPGVNL
jgi:hypothetical protein